MPSLLEIMDIYFLGLRHFLIPPNLSVHAGGSRISELRHPQ